MLDKHGKAFMIVLILALIIALMMLNPTEGDLTVNYNDEKNYNDYLNLDLEDFLIENNWVYAPNSNTGIYRKGYKLYLNDFTTNYICRIYIDTPRYLEVYAESDLGYFETVGLIDYISIEITNATALDFDFRIVYNYLGTTYIYDWDDIEWLENSFYIRGITNYEVA